MFGVLILGVLILSLRVAMRAGGNHLTGRVDLAVPFFRTFAVTQERQGKHVGPGLIQQCAGEFRQRRFADGFGQHLLGAQFRGFEFFLASRGFDVALFQRFGPPHLGVDVRLQLFVALLEGFEIAVAFVMLDRMGHCLLQRRQQLRVEVVFGQPLRRGFGHRAEQ